MINEKSELVKFSSPTTAKGYQALFKQVGLNFKATRKLWRVSSDRKAMTWRQDGKAYYWSNLPHKKLEAKGFRKYGPFRGLDIDGNKTSWYFWVGDETLIESKVVKKIDFILDGDASITTGDIEMPGGQRLGPVSRQSKMTMPMMKCKKCGKKFKKIFGPNTFEVKCPKCGSYDVEVI